jgi:hypothetical protein
MGGGVGSTRYVALLYPLVRGSVRAYGTGVHVEKWYDFPIQTVLKLKANSTARYCMQLEGPHNPYCVPEVIEEGWSWRWSRAG